MRSRSLIGAQYRVKTVKKGTRRKSPAPPFITSTLQQEASRRIGFQARRTMKAAQELYEGVEVEGIGSVGLITSRENAPTHLRRRRARRAADYIKEHWGRRNICWINRVILNPCQRAGWVRGDSPTMPELHRSRRKRA